MNVRVDNRTAILLIKSVHTLIFVFFAACIGVVVYSAISGWITQSTWIAFGLVVLECVIFVGNGWRCPLTNYAEQLGAENGSVADIFLPLWLAQRLPWIAGTLFFVASLVLLARTFI